MAEEKASAGLFGALAWVKAKFTPKPRPPRERNIPCRVRSAVSETVPHKGGTWHRYGVSFVGIAADHWDLIYRYVNDIDESEDKRAGEMFGPDDGTACCR